MLIDAPPSKQIILIGGIIAMFDIHLIIVLQPADALNSDRCVDSYAGKFQSQPSEKTPSFRSFGRMPASSVVKSCFDAALS